MSHAEPLMERTYMCRPCRLNTSADAPTTSPARTTGGSVFGSAARISSTVAAAITITR